jgi:DNA repair protein RadA/Sms
LAEAARLGFTTALVPAGHAGEPVSPAAAGGIRTIAVGTLGDAITASLNLGTHDAGARRPTLRSVLGSAQLAT